MGKFGSALSSKLATELTNLILGKGKYRKKKNSAGEYLNKENSERVSSEDNRLPANPRRQLAEKYLEEGRWELALEPFSEAIKIEPNNEQIYNERASVYSFLGDYDRALADSNMAIEINPACAFFYSNRASYYAMVGNIDLAISDLNRAVKICPDTNYDELRQMISCTNQAWVFLKEAAQLQEEGRLNEAISACTEADKINTFLVEAKNMRGSLYVELKNFDNAILDFTNAKNLRPRHFGAYFAMGNMHIVKNELDLAIKEYDLALEMNPNHASTYFNRAIAYYNKECYSMSWADIRHAESLGFIPDPGFIEKLSNVYPADKA